MLIWLLCGQGSLLEGHKLVLQLSMKKGAETTPAVKGEKKKKAAKGSTKVVVRNVAFEATAKEIRALFQPFGQIKSVRLPRKFDNSHRYYLPASLYGWSIHKASVGATPILGSELQRLCVCGLPVSPRGGQRDGSRCWGALVWQAPGCGVCQPGRGTGRYPGKGGSTIEGRCIAWQTTD